MIVTARHGGAWRACGAKRGARRASRRADVSLKLATSARPRSTARSSRTRARRRRLARRRGRRRRRPAARRRPASPASRWRPRSGSSRCARPPASSPYVLGQWVPAAIGSTTGLVCVAAVNPYVPGLRAVARGARRAVGRDPDVQRGLGDRARADRQAPRARRRNQRGRRDRGRRGARPAACRSSSSPATAPSSGAGSISPADLAPVVAAQRPDLIVLTDDQSCSQALDRLLDITDRRFRVAGLASFYEYAFGCVPLRAADAALVHEPAARPPARARPAVEARLRHRRRVDRPAPDRAAAAVAGAGDQAARRGPVIYRQTRVGERGRALHDVQAAHDVGDRRGGRRRSSPRRATRGRRASAGSCARRTSTSSRSSGTSSRATCRSSARAPSAPR